MAEVLVLVDHVDGTVRKTTSELLTIARRLGEPSAVFVGAGFDAAKETLAKYGAAKVYRVESDDVTSHLVVPQAELLAQLVGSTSPAAVHVQAAGDGVAGVVTTQSVFAGSYTVQAKVTKGTPIIAVKPNSATPEEAPA